MMDFLYELYQNDNFVLYLTIALIILIVLFVVVLIFGKRDQKLEETKRLQKIDVDAFKEEDSKVPVEISKEEEKTVVEEKSSEVKEESKSIFDDTQVLPVASNESNEKDDAVEEIHVTNFKPTVAEEKSSQEATKPLLDVEEDSKPINFKELNDMEFEDIDLEKDLNELESIKKEFDDIDIPKVNEEVKKEDQKEEKKAYKAGPQIFSSVFVNKEKEEEKPVKEEVVENKSTTASEKTKAGLFTIQDDEVEIELPTLKSEAKKEESKPETKTFSFDDISGETYDIK